MSMIISLIAAVSDNNVIGKNGKLPWNLPDDLTHFHDLTLGHPVIMGRRTYESIPASRRPLSGRTNIVLTRQNIKMPGCVVVHSLEEAIRYCSRFEIRDSRLEIFVIGGADIYRQALPLAQCMELTRVHATIDGDAFFPEVRWEEWREIGRQEHPADSRHADPFTFLTYERELIPRNRHRRPGEGGGEHRPAGVPG